MIKNMRRVLRRRHRTKTIHAKREDPKTKLYLISTDMCDAEFGSNAENEADFRNGLPAYTHIDFHRSSKAGHTPKRVLYMLEKAAGSILPPGVAVEFENLLPAHANIVTVGRVGVLDIGLGCSVDGPTDDKCSNMKSTLIGIISILRQQRLAVRCRIVVLTDKEGLVSAWDKNIITWCNSLTFGSPPGPATLQIAYLGVNRGGGAPIREGSLSDNLLN
jgi:hypothetical protein